MNVWSSIKNWHFYAKTPNMLQALSGTICPDTVLLFEFRIDILLYESLNLKNYFKLIDFFTNLLQTSTKIWKNQFFHFFHFFHFFEKNCKTLFGICTLKKSMGGPGTLTMTTATTWSFRKINFHKNLPYGSWQKIHFSKQML